MHSDKKSIFLPQVEDEHKSAIGEIHVALKADLHVSEDFALSAIAQAALTCNADTFSACAPLADLHAHAGKTGNLALRERIEASGFSLRAAIDGFYTIVVDNQVYRSTLSYPLLIHYDRRIAVRFDMAGDDIYLVTDEYWGAPYLVYKPSSCSYYELRRSTIPTEDGLRFLLASIKYYQAVSASVSKCTGHDSAPTALIVGGNDNIAHFIWNYLGGACVHAGLPKRAVCSHLVSISDNFLLEAALIKYSKCRQYIDMAALSWPDKLLSLQCMIGSTCFVRLSGHGLLPPFKQFATANTGECKAQNANDKVKLIVTVRSTARQLNGQLDVFSRVAAVCFEKFGSSLEVLVDGPCRTSQSLTQKTNNPEGDAIKLFIDMLTQQDISCRTNYGLTLLEQIQEVSKPDCILTYVSGGNAKFLGVADSVIVGIAPDSAVLRNDLRRFEDLPNSLAQHDLFSDFKDSLFYVNNAYLAYPELVTPFLVVPPQDYMLQDSPGSFNTSFDVDVSLLCELVIKVMSISVQRKKASGC